MLTNNPIFLRRFRGRNGVASGGGGGGGVSFVAYTAIETTSTAQQFPFTAGAAAVGDLMILYVRQGTTPTTSVFTLDGSGNALSMINAQRDTFSGDGLFAHTLTSADISTHTITTGSGVDSGADIIIEIFHGATTVTYEAFSEGTTPTLAFTSPFTPPGGFLGENVMMMTYQSSSPATPLSPSPGTFANDVLNATTGNFSYYGLSNLVNSTGAALTISGTNGVGGTTGYRMALS